jgi:hypothetical protein
LGVARRGHLGFWLVLGLGLGGPSPVALAKKGNAPLYEDPFDLAAGGASLTRASKEGRLFANPALLPQGGKFHRWAGFTLSLLTNKESVDTARSMLANAQGGGGDATEDGDAASEADASQTQEFIDKVFQDPVRVGWGASLSWVTRYFGLSVFSRFEADVRAKEYGEFGGPEVRFRAESYHGAALGFGIATPWRWLTLGLTGKYVYASEPDVTVEATDTESIAQFQNPDFVQDLTSHNTGVGFDAGALVFLQGSWIDWSLAGKVDDVGNTALNGASESPTELKQVISAGTGLTFHTGADAIHLALDYRDVQNAYGEETFKKVYAGTKVLIRTYVGLAAGYYNGYPSFGAEVDLILMRIAATAYTRELGDHPGVDPRHIYMITTSTGF